MKFKAGILSYVFVVVLVISVLSTLIFLLIRYKNFEYSFYKRQNRTIHHARSGLALVLTEENLPDQYFEPTLLFDNDSVLLGNRFWGGFNVNYAIATFKSYRAKAYALVGQKSIYSNNRGLYLNDTNIPITLSGDAKLSGVVHIPPQGLKTGYFNRRGYTRDSLVYGEQEVSTASIREFLNEERLSSVYEYLNGFQATDSIFYEENLQLINSFDSETKAMFQNEEIRLDRSLIGNFVVHSNTKIIVSAKVELENVILHAPDIQIENGFKGNLQAFCTDTLIIEDNVALNYPSLLCISNKTNNVNSYLEIGSAKVIGDIIHQISNWTDDSRPVLNNNLSESAQIIGNVYLDGYSYVKGEIQANSFINRLILVDSLRNSTYINYLIDAEIANRSDSNLYRTSYMFNYADAENGQIEELN